MDINPHMVAHRLWKARLSTYVEDPGAAPLDETVIGRDDACDLGKWIYGEGRKYSGGGVYGDVRQAHAAFHTQAAAVVSRVKTGDRAGARTLMMPNGPYEQASAAVQAALVRLRAEVD